MVSSMRARPAGRNRRHRGLIGGGGHFGHGAHQVREVAAISRGRADFGGGGGGFGGGGLLLLGGGGISVTEVVTCTDERWAWDTSESARSSCR
jgi:hypothetical protein